MTHSDASEYYVAARSVRARMCADNMLVTSHASRPSQQWQRAVPASCRVGHFYYFSHRSALRAMRRLFDKNKIRVTYYGKPSRQTSKIVTVENHQ